SGPRRKPAHKWLEPYEAGGMLGLQDRSRRPHESPHATDAELIAILIRLRRRHPRWDAKKLLTVAARHDPTAAWPCPATVAAHLKARGLIAPRRRRRAPGGVAARGAP